MPIIPSYGNQVQQAPLPTVRRAALQDTRGQSIGAGLSNVGEVVSAIQLDEKRKADSAAVIEADTGLSSWGNKAYLDAQSVKGKDAIGLSTKVMPDFEKQVTELEKGILSPRAKLVFRQQAMQRKAQLENQFGQYERNQTEKYYEDTYNNAVTQSIQSASLAAGNDKAVETELENQAAIISNRAKSQGLDATLPIAEARAKTHIAVLDRLLSSETIIGTAKAKSYLERVQGELPGNVVNQYANEFDSATTKEASRALANELLVKHGGDYKAMREALRKDTSIDVDVADAARQRIDYEEMHAKRAETEADNATMGSAQEWVINNPGRPIADMPRGLYTWAKSKGRLDELNNFSRTGGQPIGDDTEWTRLRILAANDPAGFVRTVPDQLPALRMKLSDAQYNNIVEHLTRASSNDIKAMESNKVAAGVINMLAGDLKAAGIDKTEKNAEQYAAFNAKLLERLDAATAQKDAPLTPAEARKIGLDLLQSGEVVVDWGLDKTKRVYQLTAEDRFVIPYEDIPAADRATIEAYVIQNAARLGLNSPRGIDKNSSEFKRKVEEAAGFLRGNP